MLAHHVKEPAPFPLDDAWGELGRDAFAVWVRLMLVPSRKLCGGRNVLAEHLQMAPRTLSRFLYELRNKGYLRLIRSHESGRLEVHILRRALIVGPTAFVRI